MKKFLYLFLLFGLITQNNFSNNIIAPQKIANNNSDESIFITKENFGLEKEINEYKNEILTLGQNSLFLIAPGKDPYVNIYQPDVDTYKVIKIGYKDKKTNKNYHIKKPEQFENIVVLSEMTNIFSANIRMQKKYSGDRESKLGEGLANVFFSKDTYEGKILIDEYNKNMPMFWVLNNVEELRAIKKYLNKNVSLENKDLSFLSKEKPLLVLKVLNDPKLEKLTENDTNFLNSYFNLFSLQDSEIKSFFEKAKEAMINRGFDMAHPRYKGESILESVFRQTEKQFKEFKAKDWAVVGGVFIFSNLVYSELKDGIDYSLEKLRNGEKSFSRKLLKKVFNRQKGTDL
ncbi:hypothetical protein GF385_03450 [Candidatus Dependentiae bacterium]|nr:hypothetical protein [Candidatus Dependentiae bacterium]